MKLIYDINKTDMTVEMIYGGENKQEREYISSDIVEPINRFVTENILDNYRNYLKNYVKTK